jgi:hypothetical protein
MTTTEHLQRIKAKCQELLAIAEKRTPGEWTKLAKSVWQNNGYIVAGNVDSPKDAAYIAACAGPAEAGWIATILAVDITFDRLYADESHIKGEARLDAQKLIAAWPEELLSQPNPTT